MFVLDNLKTDCGTVDWPMCAIVGVISKYE